jgi:hypothetical protein
MWEEEWYCHSIHHVVDCNCACTHRLTRPTTRASRRVSPLSLSQSHASSMWLSQVSAVDFRSQLGVIWVRAGSNVSEHRHQSLVAYSRNQASCSSCCVCCLPAPVHTLTDKDHCFNLMICTGWFSLL